MNRPASPDPCASPTRRDFVKAVALAAGAVPLAGSPALAARPASRQQPELLVPATAPSAEPDRYRGLKVGVASYSFRKVPLDATIRGMQRLGLRYVSVKDFHLPLKSTAEQRQAVARQFREAGIAPLSCGVITLPNDEATVRNAFEYARDIAAPVIVCKPDPASMPLLDRLVKEFDIRLAIHNHGPEDKVYPSPYDVWKVIEPHDERIGVCIDVGHTARAKVDPAEAMRKLRARLYDIHLKDVSTVEAKNASVEVEVGRGVLDVQAMLRALLDTGYAHHVGFEYERMPEDPLPGLAECMGYTRGLLAAMK